MREKGVVKVDDIVGTVYGPALWHVGFIQNINMGNRVDEAPLEHIEDYDFCLQWPDIEMAELIHWGTHIFGDIEDTPEALEEVYTYLSYGCGQVELVFNGAELMLEDEVWDEEGLSVGDVVTWRQSLPQRHRFFSVDDSYKLEYGKDPSRPWIEPSTEYWQAYGPVLKGKVIAFHFVDLEDREYMARQDFLTWTELRSGGFIVEIDPDEELPEFEEDFLLTGVSDEELDLFSGEAWHDNEVALIRLAQKIVDIHDLAEDPPERYRAVVDYDSMPLGTTLGAFDEDAEELYIHMLQNGYLRPAAWYTAGQFVWKAPGADDEPPRTGSPTPTLPPELPPSVTAPELSLELEDVVPPEIVLPPETVPPEIEEVIPPEIIGEIAPDEEELVPEEDLPPVVRKKRKKKKKKKKEEALTV